MPVWRLFNLLTQRARDCNTTAASRRAHPHDMFVDSFVQRRLKHAARLGSLGPHHCSAAPLKARKHHPDRHSRLEVNETVQAKAGFRQVGDSAGKPGLPRPPKLDADQHRMPRLSGHIFCAK